MGNFPAKSSPPGSAQPRLYHRWREALLDIFFPPRCGGCEEATRLGAGVGLCRRCTARIDYLSSSLCTCCGAPLSADGGREDRYCRHCLKAPPAFDRARSLAHYRPPVSRLLHLLKYQGDTAAAKVLAGLVTGFSCFEQEFKTPHWDLIIPVPLHRRRLQARGLNQSLVLARLIFAQESEKIAPTALIRVKNTMAQTDLSGVERRKNLRGAFALNPICDLKDKRVCLIDDVFTTGTTVNECAKTLKKSGAAEVSVWTLARA